MVGIKCLHIERPNLNLKWPGSSLATRTETSDIGYRCSIKSNFFCQLHADKRGPRRRGRGERVAPPSLPQGPFRHEFLRPSPRPYSIRLRQKRLAPTSLPTPSLKAFGFVCTGLSRNKEVQKKFPESLIPQHCVPS